MQRIKVQPSIYSRAVKDEIEMINVDLKLLKQGIKKAISQELKATRSDSSIEI